MEKPQAPGLSDSTLSALWRSAVLHRGGYQCVICGHGGTLECHHVIKRRYRLLFFDHRNGVPVHAGDCHSMADKMGTDVAHDDRDYLLRISRLTKKECLRGEGLSETEWRRQVKVALLAELGGKG